MDEEETENGKEDCVSRVEACVLGSAVKLTMHWENSCAAGLSGSITTALLQPALHIHISTHTHIHT